VGISRLDKLSATVRVSCVLGALAFALAGCGSRGGGGNLAAPNANGYYKTGQPYQIDGKWYYPGVDWGYDKTGIASWYGPDFNGKYTANGERFDMNAVTAAHPTLPLPSVVEVTNLDNGRSVQVRVNDRGPYARDRIIDVSRRAAQLLGFEAAGTARVRVRLLSQPTLQAQLLAQQNGGPDVTRPTQLAAAAPPPPVSAESLTPPAPRPATSRLALASPAAAAFRPQAVAGAGSGSKLYIQAGAFSRLANAESMRTRLERFGSVNVDSVRIKGANMYRVRIGPIATTAEADRLLSDIVSSGVPEARIAFDW